MRSAQFCLGPLLLSTTTRRGRTPVCAGQDITLSPGWAHPMFYWNCFTGLLAVIFLFAGLRLRRGTNEFISY